MPSTADDNAEPVTGPLPEKWPGFRPKLLYVITEDWFFYSHFMPMARAAMAEGYHVAVAARFAKHREILQEAGITTLDLSLERGRTNPLGAITIVFQIYRFYRQMRPDILHHISLKPVVLGTFGAKLARVPVIINAVTGFGYLFISDDPRMSSLRRIVSRTLRRTLGAPMSFCLLENHDDRALLIERGIVDPERITIVGGAGVDPSLFPPQPMPEDSGIIRVAVVARMLWSKGIDLAVEAVRLLREEGLSIELSLIGEPDPLNPAAITIEQLNRWQEQEGVRWLGRRDNISAVWREHDIALLASRGGEGLPRSLIEAAASARPIVTTAVPGCREIVIEGETGRVVPPKDAKALADALRELATDKAKRERMAAASRLHFESRFTEAQIAATVTSLYRSALEWAIAKGRIKPVPQP